MIRRGFLGSTAALLAWPGFESGSNADNSDFKRSGIGVYELNGLDIGQAMQDAHDALLEFGAGRGTIQLPPGFFEYSVMPSFELPIQIIGHGGPDPWAPPPPDPRSNAGSALIYNGSKSHAMTVRGTGQSPHRHRVNRLILKSWTLVGGENYDGHGLFLDGTRRNNENGAVARGIIADDWGPMGFCGGRGVDARGTVFDLRLSNYGERGCQTGLYLRNDKDGSYGPPSQLTLQNPNVNNRVGTALDTGVNNLTIVGGGINGSENDPLIQLNGIVGGGIYGTHIEGTDEPGSVAIVYGGPNRGPFQILPGAVSNWSVALQVGEGESKANRARISFAGHNNDTDIHVTDGGSRRGTLIYDSSVYTIRNDRRRVDGRHELHEIKKEAV